MTHLCDFFYLKKFHIKCVLYFRNLSAENPLQVSSSTEDAVRYLGDFHNVHFISEDFSMFQPLNTRTPLTFLVNLFVS